MEKINFMDYDPIVLPRPLVLTTLESPLQIRDVASPEAFLNIKDDTQNEEVSDQWFNCVAIHKIETWWQELVIRYEKFHRSECSDRYRETMRKRYQEQFRDLAKAFETNINKIKKLFEKLQLPSVNKHHLKCIALIELPTRFLNERRDDKVTIECLQKEFPENWTYLRDLSQRALKLSREIEQDPYKRLGLKEIRNAGDKSTVIEEMATVDPYELFMIRGPVPSEPQANEIRPTGEMVNEDSHNIKIVEWNKESGILRYRGSIIRTIQAQRATSIVKVLNEFEKSGWSSVVKSPFAKAHEERAIEARRELNKDQHALQFSFSAKKLEYSWKPRQPENTE